MEFIERGYFELDLPSLNVDSIPQKQREKWSEQIYFDLKRLHSIGVCWGDAKVGNIILDKESNPWLIDFGGGYTNGWVDAPLANSEEGDLQGLQRIMKFLDVSKGGTRRFDLQTLFQSSPRARNSLLMAYNYCNTCVDSHRIFRPQLWFCDIGSMYTSPLAS